MGDLKRIFNIAGPVIPGKHYLLPLRLDYEKIHELIKYRGNCKTTVPQKIDDFAASSQVQLAGLGCVDENMPKWAGEASKTTTRREMASKGRFYGAHEFCNCLYSYYFILHAPRQTGKTSAIFQLITRLIEEHTYTPLYVNVEAAQAARGNVKAGIETILSLLKLRILFTERLFLVN